MFLNFYLLVYAIYIIVVYAASRLLKKRVDEEYKGLLEWLTITSIIFPVVGLLFSLIVYPLSRKTSDKNLIDYDEYLEFDVTSYEVLREEARDSIEVLPISMSIESENDQVTKAFITKHLEYLEKSQGMYLKRAIKNSQSELSHYASTTLTLLKDRHQKKIRFIQQSLPKQSLDYYRQLSKAYLAYWNSDLLDIQDEKQVLTFHRELLLEMVQLFPEEEQGHRDLGEVYKRLKVDFTELQTFYKQCINLFPHSVEFYESLIVLLVNHEQWPEAKRYMKKVQDQQMISQSSESFQKVVDFLWSQ
ncbi:M48 family metallopeptidase [Metabacillus litoralis]|uniref:tetratricopeptide repeat protein n=1 Tax=Metabacillus litoralis TaxID=152268 RepID=UPI00203E5E26|nr:hypothetical protein [Metabacillus litoralis]MCM3162222.1 hypothetical protein [Metabacillus litoralis]